MGTIVGAFIDVLNQRMHLKYFHIDGKCVHTPLWANKYLLPYYPEGKES